MSWESSVVIMVVIAILLNRINSGLLARGWSPDLDDPPRACLCQGSRPRFG